MVGIGMQFNQIFNNLFWNDTCYCISILICLQNKKECMPLETTTQQTCSLSVTALLFLWKWQWGCWEPEISSGPRSVHLKACMFGQSLSGSLPSSIPSIHLTNKTRSRCFMCVHVCLCLCMFVCLDRRNHGDRSVEQVMEARRPR